MVIAFAAVAASLLAYIRSEKQVDHANALRQQSFVLAAELRQSSDDLTRMARTYVATGNPAYKLAYEEIIDIRDGRRPRPQDYHGGYWYLAQTGGAQPLPPGPAVPLLQLMQEGGFTEEELEKLAAAKTASDELTRTERIAMAQIEPARGAVTPEQRGLGLLYDTNYHAAKADVMRPIAEIQAIADRRTLAAVQASEAHATRMRLALLAAGMMLILSLWMTRRHLMAVLGGPVSAVYASIAALGRGDFTVPIPVSPERSESVLAWLAHTRARLAAAEAERRQAEAELVHSEQLLNTAQRIAHLGSWEVDHTTGRLSCSDETFRILEFDKASFTGTRDELMGRVHPADLEALAAARTQALGRYAPLTLEHRLLLPDGRVKWVQQRGETVFDAAGQPARTLGTMQDITERRAAEDALKLEQERTAHLIEADRLAQREREHAEAIYRTALEQASDGVFVLDRELRCIEVNQAGCRMTGYARDELLGLRPADIVAPGEQATVGPAEPAVAERKVCRKDGSILHAEVSARALPEGGFVAIVRDVGSRLVAEEALRAKLVAERANRAKTEFTSRMSHELRTPLNAILGFAQVLQLDTRHPLTDAQQGQLEHIRNAGQHLLLLIEDLLDLSRLESGDVRLRLEDVDLRQVLDAAANDLRLTAQRRGARVRVEVAEGVSGWVRGDRTRLRQVVYNLLSNAIKYSRPEGGEVVMRLTPHDALLRLSVIDKGVGMTPQQQAHLFQPFNRLGREQSDVEGSGIGLVVTRGLVQLMGGTLAVASQAGKGSEFTVELPAVAAPSAAAPAAAPNPPAMLVRPEVQGRVLYIEDDEVNRLLMQTYLSWRPQVVLTLSRDGSSGLAAARADTPDLILLDMRLPDMSGLEVLQALRAQPALRDTPCLAISADAMPEEISAALAAGATGYLTKPLSPTDLLAALDANLSVRSRSALP